MPAGRTPKSDVFDYIEGFYNRVRWHSSNFELEVDLCLRKRVKSNLLENGRVVLANTTARLTDHPLVKKAYLGG